MSLRRPLAVLASLAAISVAVPLSAGPAAAATPLDYDKQVLTTGVKDPTKVDVAPDGDVFIAERTGAVKVWRQNGELITAATLPTSAGSSAVNATNPGSSPLEEGGLHGLLLDQDFAQTRRIYLYWTIPNSRNPATKEGIFRLASFTVRADDTIDLATEHTLMENPAEWDHCCHYGGSMAWDDRGKILLSVADDTSPRDEGWNPRDKRLNREAFDADRTAQNPKDRRGKVLRLNPDGSVPADNPHVGDPAFDPYVYSMGFRSDYSISFDSVTRRVYVGNVGPDSNAADTNRGPQGYDELAVVKPGGGDNHGWPRCIGDNKPYMDYDYASGTSNGPLSCAGFTPDPVFYRNASPDFPQMGAGFGAAIMVGPVYRATKGALKLPAAFGGKLIFGDYSRDYLYTVDLTADGTSVNPATIQPFGVSSALSQTGGAKHPIAFKVGPDGALYLAEYGSGFYNNTNSQISRLVCRGCTADPKDYGSGVTVKQVAAERASATYGTGAGGGVGLRAPAAVLGGLAPFVVLGLVRRRRTA